MKKILFFLCCFITVALFAQVRQGEAILHGGTSSANSIVQANDGSYLIAGNTTSWGAGKEDIYLIKLDTNANIQWTKTIGDTGTDEESGLIKTYDGGYAICGSTTSKSAGGLDVFITKLSATGTIQWTRTIGGTQDDWGIALAQTADSGYIVFGSTQSFRTGSFQDDYIIRLDSVGNVKWTETIRDASDWRWFACFATAPAGGYIMSGSEDISLGTGITYTRIDSNGNIEWSKEIDNYVGSEGGGMEPSAILRLRNGSYITTGYQYVWDVPWIIGLSIVSDSSFDTSYVQFEPLSEESGSANYIFGATCTKDGGFAYTGYINPYSSTSAPDSLYIIKSDSTGSPQWFYLEPGSINDSLYNNYGGSAIVQTREGGYAIAGNVGLKQKSGNTNSIYFLKLDKNGYSCSRSSSPTSWPSGLLAYYTSLSDSSGTGGVVGTGNFKTGAGGSIDSIVCEVLGIDELTTAKNEVKVYPNPSDGVFTIESSVVSGQSSVEIYNMLGEKISVHSFSAPRYSLNLTGQPEGIYFYRLTGENGNLIASGKLIKE